MDRNALRRKKYAEMPPLKKAELLRSRRQTRASKKAGKALPPRVRRVPLGYVETGVSFPATQHMPCHSEDPAFVHSQPLGNTNAVFPADDAFAIREGLEFMSHCPPGSFTGYASSSFGKEMRLQNTLAPEGIAPLFNMQSLEPFNSHSLAAFSIIFLSWLSLFPLDLSSYGSLCS